MERRQSHLWQTWLTGIFACAPRSPFTWRVPTVWLDSVWLGVSAQHGREFLSSWQQGCPFKGASLTDDALCLGTVYYCTVQRLSVASNLSSWISRLLFAWSPQWIAWKTETERSSHFTILCVLDSSLLRPAACDPEINLSTSSWGMSQFLTYISRTVNRCDI